MKKAIIIILLLLLTVSISYYYYVKSNVINVIDEVEKNIDVKKYLNFKLKSISYSQNFTKTHLTNTNDVIFLHNSNNVKIQITKGGIVKNEIKNTFFNGIHFKNPFIFENKIFMGYNNGFIMVTDDYIHNFDFSKEIEKCVYGDLLYCLTNDFEVIKGDRELKKFEVLLKKGDKIKDINYFGNQFIYLQNEYLYFHGFGTTKKILLPEKEIFKTFIINKELYLISDRNIYKFENEKINLFKEFSGVQSILINNSDVYIATVQGLVYKNDELIIKNNELINNMQFLDKLYVLTENGIYSYLNSEIKKEEQSGYLSQNTINFLAVVNSNLLIGLFNKGIDKYDLITGKTEPFITNIYGINDIYNEDNNLYIAATNGLYIYNTNGEKTAYYSKKEGVLGENVSKILKLGEKLFIGTEGGLSLKKDDKFTSIYGFHGLVNNRVNSLVYFDNSVFVGTLGGLSQTKDLKVVKNFAHKDFSTPWITTLNSTNDKLYIGTYGGGIYSFDGKKISKINISKKRIFINPNSSIVIKNYILFGTLENGILIYNTKTLDFKFYDELPSLNITAFAINNDDLFVGSDFGVFILNLKEIL